MLIAYDLIAKANLHVNDLFYWRDIPNMDSVTKKPGVYIISKTTDNAVLFKDVVDPFIIDDILTRHAITVNDKPANHQRLHNALKKFWLPDTTVLYIDQTSRTIYKRLNEFYNHTLGDSRPHRGGQWLKFLLDLDNLLIHILYCDNPKKLESKLLTMFSQELKSRINTKDKFILPFANLEYRCMNHLFNKKHRIKGL